MDYSSFTVDAAIAGAPFDLELGPIPRRSPAAPPTTPVEVIDNGEPLVDVGRDLRCLGCYFRTGWAGATATTYLRTGVLVRLLEIEAGLPDEFGLAVFDGWRSGATVQALWDHYYGPDSTLSPGFLARPNGEDTPPHLTGGAVDLTLTWRDTPLALGTPFDEFSPRSALHALDDPDGPPADAPARMLRRLLYESMIDAGFAPNDQEWWHYSLGDDDWARWHDAPHALYGATAPSR